MAETAGASAGELLIAILNDALPERRRTLISSAPDQRMREERNYRLLLYRRTRLDELTKALGRSMQRSLLIRALLAARTSASSDGLGN